MAEQKGQQYLLFDEGDLILNTLETEKSAVNTEIERTLESIEKKKEKLKDLKERKENLDKSTRSIRKVVKTKGPSPPVSIHKGGREQRV